MNRLTVAGLVLLLASCTGLLVDARVFLACWLAAWWWCLGLVLGLLVNVWIHALTGGAWGWALRPAAAALARRMPWLLLALLPVALGWRVLFPWAGQPEGAWLHHISRPGFLKAWLSTPFFFARLLAYAAVWWWLARAVAPSKARATACLAVHSVVGSLAAVDLLMSLVPGWFSTAFGVVALSAQALAGTAAAVLAQPRLAVVRVPQGATVPPVSRDLGNLLLMWVLSWAYLAFMQFLVIWSEDLPREIAWYLPRLQSAWWWVGVALALFALAIPFAALLLRSVKDDPARLARVAALLLVATALDSAWEVVPSVAPHSAAVWWLLPLTFAGLSLALFGGAAASMRQAMRHQPVQEWRHAHP
jgi:hypothetical protein